MFYGSKAKTKAKQKEPQKSPRILGLGLIKLDFYLNLTDEQIKKYNIDFTKIHSPKDLAFIAEDPSLLDLIQISSSDTLSNILLYLNKASVQKSFVELITLSPIKTHPEEEHMKKIFTHVTEHNYLFSNEMSVASVPNKISFAFKNGRKLLKYFVIETDYDPYAEEDVLTGGDVDYKKKSADKKLNDLYDRINASIDKNKNEIKEIENYKKDFVGRRNNYNEDDYKKAAEMQHSDDEDVLVRDDIYNEMSNNMDASEIHNNKNLLHGNVNSKINEVNEDEHSNQNNSIIRQTQSRKSNKKINEGEDHIANMSQKSFKKEEAMSQMEENQEIDKSNRSQNKSKITNKSASKNQNQMENEEIEDLENNAENEIKENNENASEPDRFKILKTNSAKRNLNDNDFDNAYNSNNNNHYDFNDFEMEDLKEIKDENFYSSNLKTSSKKNENTLPSQRSKAAAAHDEAKSKHSNKDHNMINNDNNNKNNASSVNSKNENKQNSQNSINKKEESKKHIRALHEGSDLSRLEKSSFAGAKLTNIPAACEIEEYDFLFIDLEEFINFHTKGFHLNELAEFMKSISSIDKKPRIVLNYPNILINLNVVNLELLETIMTIMSFTDIFLFEKKECLAFFNMLNQMNYEKDLNEKQLMEYFLKEIPHQKAYVSKLGLFLDELQMFYVVERKKDKILNNLNYEINLHPKINHFNQKIVDEYKKIMTINNSYFKSIFFGGYFSSYIFTEDHFTSFFTGAESAKRVLEIFKNKIDFPDNQDFYVIKLQKNRISKNMEQQKLKQKEEKFVLDCVNKTNSIIKSYNPLFDENLNAFFASEVIRKQLKEKGFINTNGFVLYDSSYKSVLGGPPKPKKRLDTSERERHLLLAIKQNKKLLSVDLESFSKSLKGQSPTNRKLPLPSFDLNSSNLYISSKIKNLKLSKRLLKPIHSTSRRSNSKTKEKNQDQKNTNSSKSPKGKKEATNSKKQNASSNVYKSNQKINSSIDKSIENHNYKNDSLEALSKNLQKDQQKDNYNYDFKDKSKLSSRRESIMDANSEPEVSNSQAKSITFTVSRGNNNKQYTEQNKKEIYESKNNDINNNVNDVNHTHSKREAGNSIHGTDINHFEEEMQEKTNENNNENLEASGDNKNIDLENEEKNDAENQNENSNEDNVEMNNNENIDAEANQYNNQKENNKEKSPNENENNAVETESLQKHEQEGENKDAEVAENNEEVKKDNLEGNEENKKPDEDKIEAEEEN